MRALTLLRSSVLVATASILSSSSSVTYNATYKLDGGTATQSGQSYTATAADTSAVWVLGGGILTLTNPTITTSGNTSSQDNSSFYGLNAGLLVTNGKATVTGGSITTTGTGANGAFATGSSASLELNNMTISGKSDGAHAVMATQGGAVVLNSVDMTTTGGSSSAIATDRGGGTITVTGGTVTTSGNNSAVIYSTGAITANNITGKSTGAEMTVIEGANSITLNSCALTSTKEKWGHMIYQSMSGDASGNRGVFTATGGSMTYTPTSGPLFYVNNTTAIITLKGVSMNIGSGVVLSAAAGSWGTSGKNGGTVVLTADGQTLPGDLSADSISSIAATLKNSSKLTGKLTKVSLTLDASSTWVVTGNSTLAAFVDSDGISGSAISNVTGNGYTVTYDSSLSANSYLGGKTYTLAGGGTLKPAGGSSSSSTAPLIANGGVANAASGAAGVVPGSWVSIYGTNLATAAVTAGASDMTSGSVPTTLGGTNVYIDGKPAYVYYVSPTQINVVAPTDTYTGDATVTVTNSSGSSSVTATMTAVQPGLFVSSNHVLAVRVSDSKVIDATGTVQPGDVLEIFGTGFGATTTTVDPGKVMSGVNYPTTLTPTVTIGGVRAQVSYSGLVGTGLYQINLTVPSGLTAGTYPVVVTMGGATSPTTAVIQVATN